MSPTHVPLGALHIIHDRQIARHGGAPGLRDAALLEAAIARPLNLLACGTPDLFDLAAAYAFGIMEAHAFVDGNKRTALVTALTFLRLNGFAFRPDPDEGLEMTEGLAMSVVTEAEFAKWLCKGATPIS